VKEKEGRPYGPSLLRKHADEEGQTNRDCIHGCTICSALGDERRKKEKRVCHVGPTLTVASGSYPLNDHIPPTKYQARPSLKHRVEEILQVWNRRKKTGIEVPYLSNPIGTKNVEKEMRGHMKNEGF
jgi:hypothetical protein